MTKYRFEDIAYNSTEKKKPVEEDKYTYIGLEHLDPQCLEVTRYGSEVAPIGEKLVMKKGDVLFGKRRAYQKKVAIAPFDGIFSAHGMVLRPKEKVIDPKFFPMFIASDYFLDSAIKISVGSLSPTINWSALKELEFELPDLNKQRELAELLWAAEETKQAYKKLIEKNNLKIQTDFIKDIYLNKNIKKDELGKFVEFIRGVSYKPNDLFEKLNFDINTILFRANNIVNGSIDMTDVQYVSKIKVSTMQYIRSGDILMCASNGSINHLGKTALCLKGSENTTFGAFCQVIRSKGKILPELLQLYFESPIFRNIVENSACGININNLKIENLSNILVPILNGNDNNYILNLYRYKIKTNKDIYSCIEKISKFNNKLINQNLTKEVSHV